MKINVEQAIGDGAQYVPMTIKGKVMRQKDGSIRLAYKPF